MSTKADIFRAFREQILSLKKFDEKSSTNEMLKNFDSIFRSLLRIRLVLGKNLISQRQISSLQELSPDDFYSIFCRVYSPDTTKEKRILCPHCFCTIDIYLKFCPYCHENIKDDEKTIITESNINFDKIANAPDWEIDLTIDQILNRQSEEKKQEVQPIKKERKKVDGSIVFLAKMRYERLRRWAQKREVLDRLSKKEFTPDELLQKDLIELRVIITAICPNIKFFEMVNLTNSELIQKILANQYLHSTIDLGPAPIIKKKFSISKRAYYDS